MNGRQVIKKLKDAGWTVVRVRGSHHLMKKEGVMVPITRDLGIGLLSAIQRQTGVNLK